MASKQYESNTYVETHKTKSNRTKSVTLNNDKLDFVISVLMKKDGLIYSFCNPKQELEKMSQEDRRKSKRKFRKLYKVINKKLKKKITKIQAERLIYKYYRKKAIKIYKSKHHDQ